LTAAGSAVLALALLAATPELPGVRIVAPQALRPGDRASVPIEVELAADSGNPVLLTLHIEGNAVEVVRGRLLAADAKRLDARRLGFDAPIIARSEGTAILHVELATYVCASKCRRVVVGASQALRVSAWP
jgi:hypothetical protein